MENVPLEHGSPDLPGLEDVSYFEDEDEEEEEEEDFETTSFILDYSGDPKVREYFQDKRRKVERQVIVLSDSDNEETPKAAEIEVEFVKEEKRQPRAPKQKETTPTPIQTQSYFPIVPAPPLLLTPPTPAFTPHFVRYPVVRPTTQNFRGNKLARNITNRTYLNRRRVTDKSFVIDRRQDPSAVLRKLKEEHQKKHLASKSSLSDNVADWSADEVVEWLKENNASGFVEIFKQAAIDGKALVQLSKSAKEGAELLKLEENQIGPFLALLYQVQQETTSRSTYIPQELVAGLKRVVIWDADNVPDCLSLLQILKDDMKIFNILVFNLKSSTRAPLLMVPDSINIKKHKATIMTKNSADFAATWILSKLNHELPTTVDVVLVSNDRGFLQVQHEAAHEKRTIRLIRPGQRRMDINDKLQRLYISITTGSQFEPVDLSNE